MTRKQIHKLADQILRLELIHRNPDSSKEEKAEAEKQIIQIAGMLGALKGGFAIMTEVDELVQAGIQKAENKGE